MMSILRPRVLMHPKVRREPIRLLSVLVPQRVSHASTLRVRASPSFTCPTSIFLLLNRASNFTFDPFIHPQRRSFASRRDFQLDALPFSISPEHAIKEFERWAVDDQGLYYLLRWDSVRIGASYVPVWSFDINIRFVTTTKEGKKRYDWKPGIFADAYGEQPVVYIPGLSTYAGHSYRRSLINPILNTTLVFMGDQTMPFEKYMLRDMKLSNGARISIFPDPWNATRGRALEVIQEELAAIAKEAPDDVNVQTEVLGARRVYMPIYVIDYKILGAEYKAFVSGCDAGAGVSGVSHRVFSSSSQDIQKASHSFLSNAANYGMRFLGGRHGVTRLIILFQLFGSFAARLLARLPLFGFIGGIFVGFRKIIQPWMDNRSASAEWERQREYESITREYERADDFVDNGSAIRYFQQNRTRILRHLSGEHAHEQGEYDWYKEWEEWARRQWEQQQQQQTYGQQQQQQQSYGRTQQQRKTSKPEYQWDFDPNDPYSVLGIQRGATKSEVSVAFRREMLKHHPDTQAGASDAAKERATTRSKLITEAYRKIKTEMK